MSGHSKWASIKHKKGAADAKRGKIFTRIIKEITVAARLGGGDADGNPRLRTAILSAKQANMPQDNIIRAIKKGTGELEGVQYEEITYEGYGPGGVAIFIEVMTDNRNRTIGEIRSIFGKTAATSAKTDASAGFLNKKGFFTVPAEGREEDELMELIIESGAEDLKLEGEYFEITCAVENFELVRKALEDAEIPTETAELTRIPQNTVPVEESNVKQLIRLMDGLDDHDDVQKSYANFDISDEVLATLD